MVFSEQLHPRGTGAQGGQFVVKGSGGKTTKQDSLSFDGKRGSGYGAAGGDDNVRSLQQELNRLGMKDASGNPLKLDGKLGPRTTAAIKRLQRKLGLSADGKVTPAFLSKIKRIKSPTRKAAPAKKGFGSRPRTGTGKAPAKKTPPKKAAPYKMTASDRKNAVGA